MGRLAWWRARRRRVVITALLGLGVMFFAVNVFLAIGQWDPTRSSFRSGAPVEVELMSGDHRVVYLGAAESVVLRFDVYPSDFSCSVAGPSGEFALEPKGRTRLLNVWEGHMAVGSFEAPTSGIYQVSCDGPEGELVIARPARFMVGWASPQLAMLLLMPVALVAALVLLADLMIERVHGRRNDSERSATITSTDPATTDVLGSTSTTAP